MTGMHPFDAALSRGETDPAWRNFIGPFGGLTAAQAMNAILHHSQRLGDPIALTVNFAAAVADGSFEVVATPVRTNRSTQHWMLSIRQGDEIVLTGTAMTAIRRDTWSATEAHMPEVPSPSDVPPPGTAPRVEWVKRYDLRFVEGGFPTATDGRDSGNSLTRLWVRDNPPRPLDFASLTAMCDVFFPRILLRRATYVPFGTVTMTVYFHAREAQLRETGTGYLLGQTRGQGFGGGYFDHSAQLWNEAGTLLATTHQVYYFKE